MRFAPTSFRPIFGRVLSILVAIVSLAGLAGFVVAGDWPGLLRYGWGLLLLAALVFALFWFPRLDIAEHEILVRNVFASHHVPWPSIQRIDTKYALTLYTPLRKVTAWASPAPSRYASQVSNTADARLAADASGSHIRPGDLLNTTSGAAAYVIRRHWEELRDEGRLGAVDPEAMRRDIHWPTIITLGVLAAATLLGFLL